MKFRALNSIVLAAWLLANAATIRPFAQEHGQQRHYKLIDLGTLADRSFQLNEEQHLAFAGAPADR